MRRLKKRCDKLEFAINLVCLRSLSVEQWANEFRNWSNIEDGKIAKFTSDSKTKV
jgi:hypothetical protein